MARKFCVSPTRGAGSARAATHDDADRLRVQRLRDPPDGVPNKGSHGLRSLTIPAARSGGARSDVLERITHNAKGEVIDASTSWEWSTLCGEVTKLEVDLHPANLIALPVGEMISDGYRWRRWESNLLQTTLFRMIQ
jgi:hypothetical protein